MTSKQRRRQIRAMTEAELIKAWPQTQEQCCRIGARVSVRLGDIPKSDTEFLLAAAGQAMGLFGRAFKRASYGQKVIWIDMCEAALREAVAEAKGAL